jgi:hypothetical protein
MEHQVEEVAREEVYTCISVSLHEAVFVLMQ